MGKTPIARVPVRKQRSREEERIERLREGYARGSLTLSAFERMLDDVLADRAESTNDFQVFA